MVVIIFILVNILFIGKLILFYFMIFIDQIYQLFSSYYLLPFPLTINFAKFLKTLVLESTSGASFNCYPKEIIPSSLFIFWSICKKAQIDTCYKEIIRLMPYLKESPGGVLKKETLAQGFSCEFCEISKNTFSYRTPPVAASALYINKNPRPINFLLCRAHYEHYGILWAF